MVTRNLFEAIQRDYSPADRAVSETTPIYPVYIGDVVMQAFFILLIKSSTANTISLGHTGSVARFIAATDSSAGTVGDVIDGQVAVFPRAILTNQNLDADYIAVGGGGTTVPKVRFVCVILRALKF